MIIVIEGPDGSGKTTLAETIAKRTGFEIIHRDKPKTEEEKQAMLSMYSDCVRNSKNVIFDRCWYSEAVYGPVMRDKSYIDSRGIAELEHEMVCNDGGIILFCTGDPDILWERANERGENYITSKADFVRICAGYEALLVESA